MAPKKEKSAKPKTDTIKNLAAVTKKKRVKPIAKDQSKSIVIFEDDSKDVKNGIQAIWNYSQENMPNETEFAFQINSRIDNMLEDIKDTIKTAIEKVGQITSRANSFVDSLSLHLSKIKSYQLQLQQTTPDDSLASQLVSMLQYLISVIEMEKEYAKEAFEVRTDIRRVMFENSKREDELLLCVRKYRGFFSVNKESWENKLVSQYVSGNFVEEEMDKPLFSSGDLTFLKKICGSVEKTRVFDSTAKEHVKKMLEIVTILFKKRIDDSTSFKDPMAISLKKLERVSECVKKEVKKIPVRHQIHTY